MESTLLQQPTPGSNFEQTSSPLYHHRAQLSLPFSAGPMAATDEPSARTTTIGGTMKEQKQLRRRFHCPQCERSFSRSTVRNIHLDQGRFKAVLFNENGVPYYSRQSGSGKILNGTANKPNTQQLRPQIHDVDDSINSVISGIDITKPLAFSPLEDIVLDTNTSLDWHALVKQTGAGAQSMNVNQFQGSQMDTRQVWWSSAQQGLLNRRENNGLVRPKYWIGWNSKDAGKLSSAYISSVIGEE